MDNKIQNTAINMKW